MGVTDRSEKVRRAIEAAADGIARDGQRRASLPVAPAPGHLYLLRGTGEVAAEWLVVRQHPDDRTLLLLAPADDFPLAGRADVRLQPEFVHQPLTVRCGEASWFPESACEVRLRTGVLPDEAVAAVRQTLAALARGEVPGGVETHRVEADPEYLNWLNALAIAREAAVDRLAEGASARHHTFPYERFTVEPPAAFATEPPVLLAAQSGGGLLADLAESLTSVSTKFQEVSLREGGKLLFAAGEGGVRLAWLGESGRTPPKITTTDTTSPVVAVWRPGIAEGLFRADTVFPWIAGQVSLSVGTGEVVTLVVQK